MASGSTTALSHRARVKVSRAPQGLAISPDGRTLFVHNFMDRTVSVLDVSGIIGGGEVPPVIAATLNCVATEKLTAQVLLGKQLFYDAKDPRLALQEYVSCAGCHNDGGHDGRVWDLTGFGEGLRNTITLRGHGAAQGVLHWTGNFDEVQDFENQIRNLSGGLGLIAGGTPNPPLGAPNAGRSADLDALAAYVLSLTKSGTSPNRATTTPLPAAAIAGRTVFKNLNCASCHSGAGFANSALNVFRNVGTLKPSSGQRLGAALAGLDVPTLRGVSATAPYLHDGSAATLSDAVRAHNNVTIGDADLTNLVAYLSNIDDDILTAPVLLGVTLSGPSGDVSGPFTVSANFTSAVTGFATGDITVTNGTASSLAGSGAGYTFIVTPAAAGMVSVSVRANTVVDADGDANPASNLVQVNFTGSALPALWSASDIGSPGVAGSTTHSSGVYTVKGGGADIWDASDQFHYAWRTLTGTGEIIARVTSQTNTDPFAKAGVMFRETLQANSRRAMMVLSPGEGFLFQWRETTGGSSSSSEAPSYAAPNNWVRVVRNVDTFTGYRSTNGTAWTQLGSTTIPMAAAVNVGLAVTAHNNALLSTATFDNVQVNAGTLPAPWAGGDIGGPALTDIERFASGAYKISGGGADIYSSSDQFHFVSQTWSGDGEIIARISAQTSTDGWAKAGVMFRDGTAANARNIAMFLTPSNGFAFQGRTSAGATTARTSASSYAAPNNWVRLVRSGNVFTGYVSQNGTTWTQVSSVTVTLPASLSLGFAVTAADNTQISEATFDSVQVKP